MEPRCVSQQAKVSLTAVMLQMRGLVGEDLWFLKECVVSFQQVKKKYDC